MSSVDSGVYTGTSVDLLSRSNQSKQDQSSSDHDVNGDNLKHPVRVKSKPRELFIRAANKIMLCNKLSCMNSTNIKEQDEQNVIMVAIFAAINDSNTEAVQDLLTQSNNFNINYTNKNGESGLHLASRIGNIDIVKVLHYKGINLQAVDKAGENAMFCAARFAQLHLVKLFCELSIPINSQNKSGDTALHIASQMGHTDIVEYMCTFGANVSLPNKNGETALHYAVHRGYIETVKALLFAKSTVVNVLDKRKCSPLHIACKRRHISIAMLLINEGANIQYADKNGDTALHIASKEGLQVIVQSLCSLGCDLDAQNKSGHSALHVASRCGHIELVRMLLLSGCSCDTSNSSSNSGVNGAGTGGAAGSIGITAQLLALSQGHHDTAELLSKLASDNLDMYCRQLSNTNVPMKRIKLKVFGAVSAGKTSLISSLKCTYLGSFFRKNRLSQSEPSAADSATNLPSSNAANNNNVTKDEMRDSPLSSTKGIAVQQIQTSYAGELSVWEFSGNSRFYNAYDHFIGDPNCLHVICFNIKDPLEKQQQDILFWLRFIQARIAPMEPIGHKGCHPALTRVTLVSTHSDLLANGQVSEERHRIDRVAESMREKFSLTLNVSKKAFLLDAQLAMGSEMKALRQHLAAQKDSVKNMPMTTGFLEATVAALPLWRRVTASFPVVTWSSFIEYVRRQVNLLAGEEHLRMLMRQLQLSGEIIYMETENDRDLVILCPQWLCNTLIGRLLSLPSPLDVSTSTSTSTSSSPTLDSSNNKHVDHISADTLAHLFPDSAEDDISNIIRVIESLDLCYRCIVSVEEDCLDIDIPALNFCERNANLWKPNNRGISDYLIYGGLELRCVDDNMAVQIEHIFAKIIVQLRRDLSPQGHSMRHWRYGVSLPTGDGMQCQVAYLVNSSRGIEIRCRGPASVATDLYYLLDDLRCMVEQVICDACPGISLQRYILSANDMRAHRPMISRYSPFDIFAMQEKNSTLLLKTKPRSSSISSQGSLDIHEEDGEDFYDLVCFGCNQISSVLQKGLDLHMSYLCLAARRNLSLLLDGEDAMGRDWCMLAVQLGLQNLLPQFHREADSHSSSPTDRVLTEWSNCDDATIGKLLSALKELHRMDAAKVVQEYALPWHFPITDDNQTGTLDAFANLTTATIEQSATAVTSFSSSSDPSR